ncbi:MAG: hypothetical protein ABJN26_11455 [Stappiaceae bacterium]
MASHGEQIGQGDLSADRLVNANISPLTGLATDYLNHFNEVVMLFELITDMPECVSDVLAWQPLSYCDHFQNSGFAEKELAIRAYEAASAPVRSTFDTVVSELNTEIIQMQELVSQTDLGEPASKTMIADRVKNQLQPLISAAGGVIHGHDVGAVDIMPADCESSQADIDALFA